LTSHIHARAKEIFHEAADRPPEERWRSSCPRAALSGGTGEVVVDYPPCCIPPLDTRIRVVGTTPSSEIAAVAWEPI